MLQVSNNQAALDYFYRYYASSTGARRDTALFTGDPIEGYEINSELDNSRTSDILSAYLNGAGFNLVIEYEDGSEEVLEEVVDTSLKIPDYIKDLFS